MKANVHVGKLLAKHIKEKEIVKQELAKKYGCVPATISKIMSEPAISTYKLVVCEGNVTCTIGTGITILPGATIIIGEDIKTITVLNTSTDSKGHCKTRVVKK